MKIKTILSFLLICISLLSSAQKNYFKIDSLFNCKEIAVKDTILYHCADSLDKPINFTYPVNSEIEFHSNIGDFVLHTTSAEIENDKTLIYFTKQSFGLIIEVKVTLVNEKIKTDIKYWSVPGETVEFSNKKTILTLNQKVNNRSVRLIGKIEIEFAGKAHDEITMELINVTGKIDGCFNVPINKILKSRLN